MKSPGSEGVKAMVSFGAVPGCTSRRPFMMPVTSKMPTGAPVTPPAVTSTGARPSLRTSRSLVSVERSGTEPKSMVWGASHWPAMARPDSVSGEGLAPEGFNCSADS